MDPAGQCTVGDSWNQGQDRDNHYFLTKAKEECREISQHEDDGAAEMTREGNVEMAGGHGSMRTWKSDNEAEREKGKECGEGQVGKDNQQRKVCGLLKEGHLPARLSSRGRFFFSRGKTKAKEKWRPRI